MHCCLDVECLSKNVKQFQLGITINRFLERSTQPPAKITAGLIEKETLKKRISNNECRMSK